VRRLVLLAALAITGCGGATAGPPPQPPAGFARHEAAGISFDRPAAWTYDEPQPGLTEFYGAPGRGGLPPQVAVGAAPARNELADVVRLHKDMQKIRHPSYVVTEDRAVALPGAAAAQRIDARYEVRKGDAEPILLRELNLLVVTEDGRQLDFFVRSPAADFDAARLGAIFASFRLA
jgi:hypothetical protein